MKRFQRNKKGEELPEIQEDAAAVTAAPPPNAPPAEPADEQSVVSAGTTMTNLTQQELAAQEAVLANERRIAALSQENSALLDDYADMQRQMAAFEKEQQALSLQRENERLQQEYEQMQQNMETLQAEMQRTELESENDQLMQQYAQMQRDMTDLEASLEEQQSSSQQPVDSKSALSSLPSVIDEEEATDEDQEQATGAQARRAREAANALAVENGQLLSAYARMQQDMAALESELAAEELADTKRQQLVQEYGQLHRAKKDVQEHVHTNLVQQQASVDQQVAAVAADPNLGQEEAKAAEEARQKAEALAQENAQLNAAFEKMQQEMEAMEQDMRRSQLASERAQLLQEYEQLQRGMQDLQASMMSNLDHQQQALDSVVPPEPQEVPAEMHPSDSSYEVDDQGRRLTREQAEALRGENEALHAQYEKMRQDMAALEQDLQRDMLASEREALLKEYERMQREMAALAASMANVQKVSGADKTENMSMSSGSSQPPEQPVEEPRRFSRKCLWITAIVLLVAIGAGAGAGAALAGGGGDDGDDGDKAAVAAAPPTLRGPTPAPIASTTRAPTNAMLDPVDLQSIWWNWNICTEAARSALCVDQDGVPDGYFFLAGVENSNENGSCDMDQVGGLLTRPTVFQRSCYVPVEQNGVGPRVFFPVVTQSCIDIADDVRSPNPEICNVGFRDECAEFSDTIEDTSVYTRPPYATRNGEVQPVSYLYSDAEFFFESCSNGKQCCDAFCDDPACEDCGGVDAHPTFGWWALDETPWTVGEERVYEFGTELTTHNYCFQIRYTLTAIPVEE